jgi:hypothetical protein
MVEFFNVFDGNLKYLDLSGCVLVTSPTALGNELL